VGRAKEGKVWVSG